MVRILSVCRELVAGNPVARGIGLVALAAASLRRLVCDVLPGSFPGTVCEALGRFSLDIAIARGFHG